MEGGLVRSFLKPATGSALLAQVGNIAQSIIAACFTRYEPFVIEGFNNKHDILLLSPGLSTNLKVGSFSVVPNFRR